MKGLREMTIALSDTCSCCRRPCAVPDNLDIDPLCDLCIRRLQGDTATTIADCLHTLDNAMQDRNGVWYCLHRAHTSPLPITKDPIANLDA